MARYHKNTVTPSGSKAIRIPQGPTSNRPVNSKDGQIRFNTTEQRYEGYISNAAIGQENLWFPFTLTSDLGPRILRQSFTIYNSDLSSSGSNIGGGAITDYTIEFNPNTFTYTGNYTATDSVKVVPYPAEGMYGAGNVAVYYFTTSNSNVSVTSTNGVNAAFAMLMGFDSNVSLNAITFGNVGNLPATSYTTTTFRTANTVTNGANVITSATTGSNISTLPTGWNTLSDSFTDYTGSLGRGWQVGDKIVIDGSSFGANSNLTINVTAVSSNIAVDLYALTEAPSTLDENGEGNIIVFIGGLYQHPRKNYFLTNINNQLYIDISGASYGSYDPLNGVDMVVIYNITDTL
jgi:hypothetical protein